MDIFLQYALPSVISGIIAIVVATISNNKNMALIEYRLGELEKKLDKYQLIEERVTKLELRATVLEMKGNNDDGK